MPPLTPQITVHGNLMDLLGVLIPDAKIVVQLCGYGSQIPRIVGTTMIAEVAPEAIDIASGAFSFVLWGNDVIVPAGSFYTIQIQNDNGDVIQTNAYQFVGTQNVDLSSVAVYTPFVPPSPPAPAPGTLDVVVAFAVNAIFNALNTLGIITFEMILTGNLAAPTLINLTPGQIVTFIFQQDGVGGRGVAPPANVFGLGVPDPTPNATSTQSFVVRSTGNCYPLGPMTTV